MNLFSLQNKKVIVTGGSRGIGASIVTTLAEMGAQVAFTYSSNEAKAHEVLKTLKGTGHICLQLDVSDSAKVEAFASHILNLWGEVDGIVNNAGITKDQLILRMKNEDFDQVISTNLKGPFYVTKAFAKTLVKSRKGSIVNISSVSAQGNAGQSNYAASKGGLESFTKSIALELASRGIRANCVAPGYIKSDMTSALSEDQLKGLEEKIPMGRAGDPSEIAQVVGFLLSDAASYMTGQVIHVNGGMHLN